MTGSKLLGEPFLLVTLDYLCSMVTIATKMLTVDLCRECRRSSSSQNFLFIYNFVLIIMYPGTSELSKS
jgi:hypothetical protein